MHSGFLADVDQQQKKQFLPASAEMQVVGWLFKCLMSLELFHTKNNSNKVVAAA